MVQVLKNATISSYKIIHGSFKILNIISISNAKVQSTLRRGSAEKFVNAPVDKEPLGIITNFYQVYLALLRK
jgi:hypothetical protein